MKYETTKSEFRNNVFLTMQAWTGIDQKPKKFDAECDKRYNDNFSEGATVNQLCQLYKLDY